MRRYFCLLMAVLGLTCGVAHGVLVSVPDTIVVTPGETFDVPVSVDQASGVLGYFFTLSYSDGFDYVSVSQGTLTSSWSQQVPHEGTNQVAVAGSGTVAVNGSGSIAVVRLRALSSTPNGHACDLAFEAAELNDGAIPMGTRDGRLVVSTVIVVAPPAVTEVAPGQSFSLPLTAYDAADVFGYFVDLTYDAGVLRYDGFSRGALPLAKAWTGPSVNPIAGRIRAAESGSTPLASTGALININFTVLSGTPYGTEVALGLVAELNDGALTAVAGNGVVRVVDPYTVWLDFNGTPGGDGSESAPCNTMAEAVARATPGHTVRIKPGLSTERPRITKVLRLVADDGPVRIGVGVGPVGAYSVAGQTYADVQPPDGVSASTQPNAAPSTGVEARVYEPGMSMDGVPTTVLPFTQDEDGAICLGDEREISIKLHGAADIVPDTISVLAIGMPQEAYEVNWSPASEVGLRDLWVHIALNEGYGPVDCFLVIVTAESVTGATIDPVGYSFSPDCDAAAKYRLDHVPQPEEGTLQVFAVPAELLPLGLPPRDSVYYFAPEHLYDIPQWVWLPVSDDGAWILECLVSSADGPTWRPGRDVPGFIATDKLRALKVGGEDYIGCLTNHGALVSIREVDEIVP